MENYKRKKTYIRHRIIFFFIWPPLVAFLIFDIFLEFYHRLAFPLYGIPTIKRSKYIKIDRHKLNYISISDKINCAYCGYANGLLNYATKIVGETEKYWCGIKHKPDDNFIEPFHHSEFVLDYDNEEQFKKYITNEN